MKHESEALSKLSHIKYLTSINRPCIIQRLYDIRMEYVASHSSISRDMAQNSINGASTDPKPQPWIPSLQSAPATTKTTQKRPPRERTPVWLSVCPRAGVVSLNFPIYDSRAEGRGPISAYRRFSKCILGYGFYCFIAIPRTNHSLPSLPLAVSLKS